MKESDHYLRVPGGSGLNRDNFCTLNNKLIIVDVINEDQVSVE